MKLRIIIFSAVLIFSLGLLSCGEEEVFPEAGLSSLTVGVTRAERIPGAISASRLDSGLDLYNSSQREMYFNNEGPEYTEEVRVTAKVSSGARAEWGIGTRSGPPYAFYPTGVPATIDQNDFIYIKVTSSDGYVTNYYRFFARVRSPVRELAGLKIAVKRDANLDTANPGNTPDDPEIVNGTISVTLAESLNALLEPETQHEKATVKYALVDDGYDPADLVFEPRTRLTLGDRQWLFTEVTAENTIDKFYYRFQVNVGRMVSLEKLEFIGVDPDNRPTREEAFGKGFPGTNWTAASGATAVTSGKFASPYKPTAGFRLSATPDDPLAVWEYGVIATTGAQQPTWAPYNNNTVQFTDGQVLAIRVTPQRPGAQVGYYKVQVSLLAAGFKTHPKPAVYVKSDGTDVNSSVTPAVLPLTFELDRVVSGSATYQWYEANSWYGGYGFDADGKILGIDAGFTADSYHVATLDEKSNVSYHNGGNQYYRLPETGRAIPAGQGGTSPTFTPPVNNRPFIGGFSNVTNYYWVVVTDGGLKATSKRAVIVTEYGRVWDLGKVTDTTVTKKHFIIDMNNLKDRSGNAVSNKNINTFASFREPYQIDLRGALPAGFNINEYSMATAWALFYLRDGTPWIQNWTQGNISFIDINETNPRQDGNKQKIVLYYNLTNNNGTLGLEGDGKEPQGESLNKTFTHVVIMPSGEKPIKRMPPFQSDGVTPLANNDAQGWFCGFIELVELRFEGPTRVK
jgi:hypothetical protein